MGNPLVGVTGEAAGRLMAEVRRVVALGGFASHDDTAERLITPRVDVFTALATGGSDGVRDVGLGVLVTTQEEVPLLRQTAWEVVTPSTTVVE